MALSRDKAFGMQDIKIKEITIPDHIPAWGGETVYIKQLTRGDQDEYLRRRAGGLRMKQDVRAGQQDISNVASFFGHDAWIMVRGCVDADGKPLFKESDIAELNKKNGEAIGWIAAEIVKFSGMAGDVTAEEEAKNS